MPKPYIPRKLVEGPLGLPPKTIRIWQCDPEADRLTGQKCTVSTQLPLENLHQIAPGLETGLYYFQTFGQGRAIG